MDEDEDVAPMAKPLPRRPIPIVPYIPPAALTRPVQKKAPVDSSDDEDPAGEWDENKSEAAKKRDEDKGDPSDEEGMGGSDKGSDKGGDGPPALPPKPPTPPGSPRSRPSTPSSKQSIRIAQEVV